MGLMKVSVLRYLKSFMTNPLNIILMIWVYDYSNIGSSLVVYILL